MKSKAGFIFVFSFFTFLVLTFTGCEKDNFDVPPLTIPTVNFTANTKIDSLLKYYINGALTSIKGDVIICGVVSANDQSGNFYDAIIIQDATGGIEVNIAKAELYTTYGLGQKVLVKCEGMYLGEYDGLIQLGYDVNGAIGSLPATLIGSYIYLDSLPGKQVQPVTLKFTDLTDRYVSCLIKVDSVQFLQPGQMFAPQTASNTNSTIVDNYGNSLIIRTSKYANFASDVTPSGTLDITGILSKYNTEYELYIRDLNDIIIQKKYQNPNAKSQINTKYQILKPEKNANLFLIH